MPKPKVSQNLDKSLKELEELVEKMEQGDLDLEKSMALFERGVKLVKQCQTTLAKTEQKVQLLTQSTGSELLTDFEEDE